MSKPIFRLKAVLQERGISQGALATRMGKTRQYVSYLANSPRCNPRLTMLCDLAAAIGCTPADLIEDAHGAD